jgi:hypothetical protein
MQTTASVKPRVVVPRHPASTTAHSATRDSVTASSYAVAEIHAHIAVRDCLLAEAEAAGTRQSLNRVFIANEFVRECLKTPRAPYGAQHLAETEATRERTRCATVSARVAQLRERLAATEQLAA